MGLSEQLRENISKLTESSEDMLSQVEEIVVSIEEAIDSGRKYPSVTKPLKAALRYAKQAEKAAEEL
jgi:methyl-accepting chemotaxis protein